MNIEQIAFSVSAFILIISVGLLAGTFFRYVNRKLEPDPIPGDPRPLAEYRHRQSLTDLLQLNRITGNADIRDGRVFVAPEQNRIPILAMLLNEAHNQAMNDETKAGSNVYFASKNPGEGSGWTYRCLGQVEISDLAEAARMLIDLHKQVAKLTIEKAKS